MNKILFISAILLSTVLVVNAQITGGGNKSKKKQTENINVSKNAFTIQLGIKNALGFEYERLLSKQLGMGLSLGTGGAQFETKIHFKPQINSSLLGLGVGALWLHPFKGKTEGEASFYTNAFYEYRSKKRFTFSLGLGLFREYITYENYNEYGSYQDSYTEEYVEWEPTAVATIGIYFAR